MTVEKVAMTETSSVFLYRKEKNERTSDAQHACKVQHISAIMLASQAAAIDNALYASAQTFALHTRATQTVPQLAVCSPETLSPPRVSVTTR